MFLGERPNRDFIHSEAFRQRIVPVFPATLEAQNPPAGGTADARGKQTGLAAPAAGAALDPGAGAGGGSAGAGGMEEGQATAARTVQGATIPEGLPRRQLARKGGPSGLPGTAGAGNGALSQDYSNDRALPITGRRGLPEGPPKRAAPSLKRPRKVQAVYSRASLLISPYEPSLVPALQACCGIRACVL